MNNFDFYQNTKCRFCESTMLEEVFDLGKQPPANSFIREGELKLEQSFPLRLFFCTECFLVQLTDVVSGNSIFKDYHYKSSSSRALVESFNIMCNKILKSGLLAQGDLVLDIGCNDGIILDNFSKQKFNLVGVEPSNIAEIAKSKGYKIYSNFFNEQVAGKIIHDHGKAKLITATNMYAHVDDMVSLTSAIKKILHPNGSLIIEVSYLLDMVNSGHFDVIYHEHLSYYSVTSLKNFLSKFDLDIVKVERLALGASGPAIRLEIKHCNKGSKPDKSIEHLLLLEKSWGVHLTDKLNNFGTEAEKLKISLLRIIEENRNSRNSIGGFTAPAKGNTLLNFIGADCDLIFKISENNKKKIGKLTPGSNIEIISDGEFLKHKFDFSLLLAWNYKDFFLKHSDYAKTGGKFIVPFPQPHIIWN